MENKRPKIFFLSFADKRFHKSLRRIKQQAISSKYFDEILTWTEDDIEVGFKNRYAEILTADTFYLCAWKPKVVQQVLDIMSDGDILMYADVGCHINPKATKRFLEYLEIVRSSVSGILATQFVNDMPESMWTKGDLFDFLNCRDQKNIVNSNQIQATTFFIEKRASSIMFIDEWGKVCTYSPSLLDRTTCIANNYSNYQEHRSDQSAFSILAKKVEISLISANEVQGSANWETEMIDFPIWAKRDRVMDDSFWIHPTPGRAVLLLKRKWKSLIKN